MKACKAYFIRNTIFSSCAQLIDLVVKAGIHEHQSPFICLHCLFLLETKEEMAGEEEVEEEKYGH